jgi:acetate---CoA ligase (ADP-forming) subunit beta
MEEFMNFIHDAIKAQRKSLDEFESKKVLTAYGIPVNREELISNLSELKSALDRIGFPCVLKACSHKISHKTEQNLVRINLTSQEQVVEAFQDLSGKIDPDDAILIQEMIKGPRELMIGMTRDPQFGPCVMFGLGGIFTEVLKDVSFRMAPLTKADALEMISELRSSHILDDIRGMEKVDTDLLQQILIAAGRIGMENENVQELDINPLIVQGNKPIAVDALIVLR